MHYYSTQQYNDPKKKRILSSLSNATRIFLRWQSWQTSCIKFFDQTYCLIYFYLHFLYADSISHNKCFNNNLQQKLFSRPPGKCNFILGTKALFHVSNANRSIKTGSENNLVVIERSIFRPRPLQSRHYIWAYQHLSVGSKAYLSVRVKVMLTLGKHEKHISISQQEWLHCKTLWPGQRVGNAQRGKATSPSSSHSSTSECLGRNKATLKHEYWSSFKYKTHGLEKFSSYNATNNFERFKLNFSLILLQLNLYTSQLSFQARD